MYTDAGVTERVQQGSKRLLESSGDVRFFGFVLVGTITLDPCLVVSGIHFIAIRPVEPFLFGVLHVLLNCASTLFGCGKVPKL